MKEVLLALVQGSVDYHRHVFKVKIVAYCHFNVFLKDKGQMSSAPAEEVWHGIFGTVTLCESTAACKRV